MWHYIAIWRVGKDDLVEGLMLWHRLLAYFSLRTIECFAWT